jgi:hypothetical protein
MAFTGAMSTANVAGEDVRKSTPFVRDQPKVKPNEPCYCGSGKKYKNATARESKWQRVKVKKQKRKVFNFPLFVFV